MSTGDDDICGLCGQPGADKMAQSGPHWPGERKSGGPYVHAQCENEERYRAWNNLSPSERDNFLDEVIRHG